MNCLEDLPECIRFPTAVFAHRLSEDKRREILSEKYNIPQREYPKRELNNMSCIFEDSKRRYYRDGKEDALVNSVLAIMSNLNYSVDQAMDTLNIPESERDNLRSIIDSQTAS